MHKVTHKLGWIVGAVVLVCGLSALRGTQGLSGPFELFRQIRELQKQNRDLELEIAGKQERLRRLDGSESENELEVKRRLKYLKPGERQMVLPTTPAAPAQQQQQQAPQPEVAQ
jgi:hypothetical protein